MARRIVIIGITFIWQDVLDVRVRSSGEGSSVGKKPSIPRGLGSIGFFRRKGGRSGRMEPSVGAIFRPCDPKYAKRASPSHGSSVPASRDNFGRQEGAVVKKRQLKTHLYGTLCKICRYGKRAGEPSHAASVFSDLFKRGQHVDYGRLKPRTQEESSRAEV